MKRTLITFIVTVAALFAATPYAIAYDCEVDGIYYSRISATEVEVTNKVFSDQNYAAYLGDLQRKNLQCGLHWRLCFPRLRIHHFHYHPQQREVNQELCFLQLQRHDKRQYACKRDGDRHGSIRGLRFTHSNGVAQGYRGYRERNILRM